MKTILAALGCAMLATAAHAQSVTETCRYYRGGYTCNDYITGPIESVRRHVTVKEHDPEQQMREWEAACRTTIYFNPANFAHAARVARRCGMKINP